MTCDGPWPFGGTWLDLGNNLPSSSSILSGQTLVELPEALATLRLRCAFSAPTRCFSLRRVVVLARGPPRARGACAERQCTCSSPAQYACASSLVRLELAE